jgi:hypothetical protein
MLHAIAYANSHCFSLSDLHHPSLNRLQCWFSVAWEDGDANFLFLSFNLTVLVQKNYIDLLIINVEVSRFNIYEINVAIYCKTTRFYCISRGKIFRFFVYSFILLCYGAYLDYIYYAGLLSLRLYLLGFGY